MKQKVVETLRDVSFSPLLRKYIEVIRVSMMSAEEFNLPNSREPRADAADIPRSNPNKLVPSIDG